jgi:outer membrane protein assembly factor BamB
MRLCRVRKDGWGRARALTAGLLVGGALLVACTEPVSRAQPGSGPAGLSEVFRAPVAGAFNAYIPVSDGIRLYADVEQAVKAFDLRNGAPLWSYTRPRGGPSSLVPRGGRLFFAGDTAVALDAATGRELWRYALDSFGGFCESDGDADAFYVGTKEHRVYALRATDGTVLWSRDLGPDWPYKGVVRGMTVSGDTVYAVVEHDTGVNGHIGTGDVFALDRRTGDVLWVYRNGDGTKLNIIQSAGRIAGNLLLLSANWDNQYVALNRLTGQEAWRAAGSPGFGGPDEAPEVRGERVFVASQDQHAMALELSTGRVLWRSAVASGATNVALCGNRLLVLESGLSILDPETGRLLERAFDSSTGEVFHTDFVVVGDRAYVFGRKELYSFRCPG